MKNGPARSEAAGFSARHIIGKYGVIRKTCVRRKIRYKEGTLMLLLTKWDAERPRFFSWVFGFSADKTANGNNEGE